MKTPLIPAPLRAALIAATLAIPLAGPLATPALAGGGQLSISIAPQNAQDAQLLRLGLAVYALNQNIHANGHVSQAGYGNAAGIAQGGPNNHAIIHQEGCNHTGTIDQRGGNNAYGLFQYGCNTNAAINQNGGQSGLTFQFGW